MRLGLNVLCDYFIKMSGGSIVPNEIRKRMKVLGYYVFQRLECSSEYGVVIGNSPIPFLVTPQFS